ncbi:bridging integrator 3 [Enhydra lutris kenyoni]|uniref:Bridging integrator 3 n=4 Tax=Caniformia TaxID=379584 RepID=A0A2Y9KGQ5_ENHLU|nr:bridging integrator 3 [Enhydra lutris kenyoni]
MDIAGSHVALSRGQRSQPYPNILVSCQHETSFLSNQSDPAQPEPHRRSLCASPSSPGQGDPAIPHTHQHTWGSQKRVLGAKAIAPVERDFEREYGKLQQLEEQTRRLQKDMKKSTDADLAMSKSAVKISLDLLSNPLCEQDQDFLNMVTALDTAMKRMDAFNQEKVNQIQKTVIEPLKKFGSVFPSLNMAVKRREQALQDYRRLQAKVEKYEEKEKTGPVLAKLHQAREELRPVRDDFEAKNKQLLDEMPRFYHSRLDYFQPSFEALIRAQVGYYSEMQKIFGDLTQQLDQPGHPDEQRERENEARLSELRALSIVADD